MVTCRDICNLKLDEHINEYYSNCLNREVVKLKGHHHVHEFFE